MALSSPQETAKRGGREGGSCGSASGCSFEVKRGGSHPSWNQASGHLMSPVKCTRSHVLSLSLFLPQSSRALLSKVCLVFSGKEGDGSLWHKLQGFGHFWFLPGQEVMMLMMTITSVAFTLSQAVF